MKKNAKNTKTITTATTAQRSSDKRRADKTTAAAERSFLNLTGLAKADAGQYLKQIRASRRPTVTAKSLAGRVARSQGAGTLVSVSLSSNTSARRSSSSSASPRRAGPDELAVQRIIQENREKNWAIMRAWEHAHCWMEPEEFEKARKSVTPLPPAPPPITLPKRIDRRFGCSAANSYRELNAILDAMPVSDEWKAWEDDPRTGPKPVGWTKASNAIPQTREDRCFSDDPKAYEDRLDAIQERMMMNAYA